MRVRTRHPQYGWEEQMAKGYSLHLGLNSVDPKHYEGWSGELNACENDASDMAAIAKAGQYTKSTLLLSRDATSTRFISEMMKLARTLKSGDFLLLTYSGHGGQIPDADGDEDDKMDETWCLFDRQLIDDEMYRLLGKFAPGVRILVLSDSCHSGTITRERIRATGLSQDELVHHIARSAAEGMRDHQQIDAEVRSRLAPIKVIEDTYNKHKDLYLALQSASAGAEKTPPKAGVILISGCMDGQLSLDGTANGLFTGILKSVWNSGKFEGGYRLFQQTIVGHMPSTQTPNLFLVGTVAPAFVNQRPFTV
jgi:metacaspase-1